MTNPRTLTLLSSQQPFLDQLPNLGDRALYRGFLLLAERHGRCSISHGGWKAFPHLTRSALAAAGAPPAAVLANWAERIRRYSPRRIQLEDGLARLPEQPPLPWLARASALEEAVRMRTGAAWGDALRTRLRAHQGAALLRQIADGDAAMLCAGGIIADHLGRTLPGRLLEPWLALAAGKPLALVNYSVSLDDPLNRALAAAVLPRAAVHLLREPRSKTVLSALGVPTERIINSVDSAFANPVPPRALPATEAFRIGIMVRGDRPADLGAWAALVSALRAGYGVEVHYLHGCLRHDPPVRRALGRRCQLADDGQPLDLPGLYRALGRLGLLITDRYHGMVLALQTGTPVLPIASTTHKTEGLAALTGYPLPVLPPPAADTLGHLLDTVAGAWRQRAPLAAQGLGFTRRARAQLEQDYAELFRRLWGAVDRTEAGAHRLAHTPRVGASTAGLAAAKGRTTP